MKALLALGVLGLLPVFGYSLETARAAAFHLMAVGQLFLTYPSRHTFMRPLGNPYLHLAVTGGLAIQVLAASVPIVADSLGNAAIPAELWTVVIAGSLMSWGLAEAISRFVWRDSARREGR